MEREIDRKALEFIRGAKGPLTYRQIAQGIGMRSTGSVYNILQRLQLAGYIERRDYYHRDVRLSDRPKSATAA